MSGTGEFDFIRTRLGPLTRNHAGALGLRDDAAILTPQPGQNLVLACDTLIEGVHFRAEDSPDVVAARALGSNLSDLAAMGAEPVGYLSALSWPREHDDAWRQAFTEALAALQARHDLSLLGGDTTSTPGPFCISLTLIGQVPSGAGLLRSGARPGDVVWVSGVIGDGALGLAAAQGRAGAPKACRPRYDAPEPRLALGVALRGLASSCIDVSDGLVADCTHLAEASAVAIDLHAADVPLSHAASDWVAEGGEGGLERLLAGGDDYELVFTVPDGQSAAVKALGERLGLPLTRIGQVRDGAGVQVLDGENCPITLSRKGFTHF